MKKLIIIILHIFIFWPIASLAIQTNVNEVTDLFDKHIEGKQEFLQNLEEQNNNAINQIKSGVHHNSIEGIGEAQSKASELSAIKETELDNAGRSKRACEEYQFYDENELEPDYTKPGNRLHKEDSDDIVSNTDDTMHKIGSNFIAKLNSEGFDCKTVKGSVVKEPTYYIEIKRENQNNTEYDQLFCEEPRNQYKCTDFLSLTCKRKVMQWANWQNKTMEFSVAEINQNWKWMWHSVKVRRKVFLCYFRAAQDVIDGLRGIIAQRLGVSIDQIGAIKWRYSPWEHETGIRKEYMFSSYMVDYKYRDGHLVCDQWKEDWTERCYIK